MGGDPGVPPLISFLPRLVLDMTLEKTADAEEAIDDAVSGVGAAFVGAAVVVADINGGVVGGASSGRPRAGSSLEPASSGAALWLVETTGK